MAVKNLSCGYNHHKLAEGINFNVTDGDIITVLGPNGVGKTTLLKTIMGFIKPCSGSVLLDNKDLSGLPRKYTARHIGYVPQVTCHSFSFSIEEVVIMGRLPHLNAFSQPGNKDMLIVEDVLKKLNIEHMRKRFFSNLSGGEQQIVMIARALVQEPRLLIMDEPTSNLDFGNQIRILKIIKQLSQNGISILFTTHFPDQAFLCDAKVILFYKNTRPDIGDAANILSPVNLKRAYGIDIDIITKKNADGSITKTCVPLFGV
nr:ABC transporter ATP-binding protein [Pectinatus haikarae]